jgi:hypothetical protein
MVRDTVLAVSGLLAADRRTERVPAATRRHLGHPIATRSGSSDGADRYRRGLYVFIRRSAPYPSFLTFDDQPGTLHGQARAHEHAAQALTTLNDEVFFEAAKALAARVVRGTPDLRSRVTFALRLVLSRPPASKRPTDRRLMQQLDRFRADRAAAARHQGYAVGDVDAAEQAAWTLVANALLNLDETVTKE